MEPSAEPGTLAGRELGCLRAEVPVFARVDVTLPPGGALVVRGGNGSGKSSLLRMLAGLLPPATGELTWNGEHVDPADEAHRARVAYLGHAEALKPELTVRENVVAWTRPRGREEAAADNALAAVGLGTLAGEPVRRLSNGQRRRAALARVHASGAPVWLLDEPAVGLDAPAAAQLTELLAAHRAAGGSVAVATHQALDLGAAEGIDLDAHAPAPPPVAA